MVMEPRGFPFVVSIRIPETLYVPPDDTDDGKIRRIIVTLSLRVVAVLVAVVIVLDAVVSGM